MIAAAFEIVARPSHINYRMADISNFHLREIAQLPAGKILENPHISLYCLDFEKNQAVFVETPADVDLSQAPFYLITQFEKAKRVYTISFDTMLQLAQSVTVADSHLILIHSVGRCGSTLASQIFAQLPGVINISEPIVLKQLVIARNKQTGNEDDLLALLRATMLLLCKTPAETAWVIKGQSFVIELGDWLHKIFPRSKNLFLYRHAETWLQSSLNAYGRTDKLPDKEQEATEKQRRERLGALVPAIAQYDNKQPLSHAGMLSLMWLTTMERYVQYCNMGIEMLAIRYDSWRSAPRETAVAMLDYCGIRPTDMTAIYETLSKDSQAGTRLSRKALEQRQRDVSDLELEELRWHLQQHTFINKADFMVENTLKI